MEAPQGGINMLVALTVVILQFTVSTCYYFQTFKKAYMRLVNTRTPVFDRSLMGTIAACLVLTGLINWLVLHFGMQTWQDGMLMAAVLLLIDTCLNARHYFFEGRPFSLFLLHLGYHATVLFMTCCLLAVFGTPLGHPVTELSGTAAAGNLQGRVHGELRCNTYS